MFRLMGSVGGCLGRQNYLPIAPNIEPKYIYNATLFIMLKSVREWFNIACQFITIVGGPYAIQSLPY